MKKNSKIIQVGKKKGFDSIMWKKIIYFSVSIIFAIIFYLITYSANLSDYKVNMVNEAISKEEYHVVPQIFLEVPFDTNSVIEDNSENAELEIYPAAGMVSYSLNEGETNNVYSRYEKAYLFFIFNINYPLSSFVDSGNNNVNKSAIEFYNGDQKYTYYLVQNALYNESGYVENPKNERDYSLCNERNLTTINEDWGFIPLSLSETAINLIKESIGGNITNIKLIDCRGEVQLSEEVSLNFDEDFFNHEYIVNINQSVNERLEKYYATTDKDKINTLTNEINDLLISFKDNFEENTKDTGYAISLPEDVLTPGSIYWKSIAYLVLFFILVMMFYFLLFHFKKITGFIKSLASRNNKNVKNNYNKQPYIVKKDPVKPAIEEEKVIIEETETSEKEEKSE